MVHDNRAIGMLIGVRCEGALFPHLNASIVEPMDRLSRLCEG